MRSLLLIFSLLILISCSQEFVDSKNIVFVSILPQKYFVEQISGDLLNVQVMVKPGHSPATYEPLPQQIAALQKTDIYFRIGVPFEDVWIEKISKSNAQMKIVDTRKNIQLQEMEDFHDIISEEEGHHHEEKHDHHYDPHIWLSPKLVKIQAKTILQSLIKQYPEHKAKFENNYAKFDKDLTQLQVYLRTSLKPVQDKKFLVFHPVWGYFSEEYQLHQIPIEIEGKTPTPRELSEIIDLVKRENIKIIFVQKQFSTKEAETIAKEINGKVISIDPLAENYIENLRSIGDTFSQSLQ